MSKGQKVQPGDVVISRKYGVDFSGTERRVMVHPGDVGYVKSEEFEPDWFMVEWNRGTYRCNVGQADVRKVPEADVWRIVFGKEGER